MGGTAGGAGGVDQGVNPTSGKVLQPQPNGPDDHQNFGYGYQWWLLDDDDGSFAALGIYGQTIYVNPKRHVVIVQTAAWPEPDPDERWDETIKVMQTLARVNTSR